MFKKKTQAKNISIPESQIQKAILDYLSYLPNIYFFRSGSGAIKTEKGKYFKTGKKGCPDIIVCKNGKFIGIEVKTEKGKLSPAQIKAREEIIKAGGIYLIAKSIDDVRKII